MLRTMNPPRFGSLVWLACAVCASCFHGGYRHCAVPDSATLDREARLLSETGLDAAVLERGQLDAHVESRRSGNAAANGDGASGDASGATRSPQAREYRPRFELWSDGATKRRWVSVPEGERIDNSNPEQWRFPVGTKFWKEFSLNGRRLETRLLHKTGPETSDWAALSYVWDASGSDAVANPTGASNVHGTGHDVPSAAECMGCHGGRTSRVLGFSAVQLGLSHPGEQGPPYEGLEGLFTHPLPLLELALPERDQAALGYLHANCSHCHNHSRPPRTGARCYDPEKPFDLSLTLAALDGTQPLPAVHTTQPTWLVPGAPDDSLLLKRMAEHSLFRPRMPSLGSERRDEAGVSVVREWIGGTGE